MTEIPLFINPTAGRGRAGKRLARIEAILGESGVPIKVVRSTGVGDLENRVLDACESGARRIIIAGGDGSLHEAVNGIGRSDNETAFAVIPTGTGNDFAKAAGITLDWEAATTLLADRIVSEAPPRKLDLGRFNDRYFCNGAGIGFDARVTHVARSMRWKIGDLVYLFAVFKAMRQGIATPAMQISSGGRVLWEGPLTLANIANGPWVGGMFHIAPMASNADRLFDLVIAGPVNRRRVVVLLPKLLQGTHLGAPEVVHHQVSQIDIVSEKPVVSHLDGEVQKPQTEFSIRLMPGALSLL